MQANTKPSTKTIEVKFTFPEDEKTYSVLKKLNMYQRRKVYTTMESILESSSEVSVIPPLQLKDFDFQKEKKSKILRIQLDYMKYPSLLNLWDSFKHGSRSFVFKLLLVEAIDSIRGEAG